MIVLWGSRGLSSTIQRGEFGCPVCRSVESYDLRSERPWFTLYFIPLFPIGSTQNYVQCRRCRNAFSEAVLHDQAQLPPEHDVPVGVDDGSSRWRLGDRVLAIWPPEGYWYPAVVRGCSQGLIRVDYDDGDREVVYPEEVKAIDITVGTKVFARWQAGAQFAPATVERVDGETLHLRYEDGHQEQSTLSLVRVQG